MNTFFLLLYIATWAAIPHLLKLKKRPAATLAWLWAILFVPFLGPFIYFCIGTDRIKRQRLKRRRLFSARQSRRSTPSPPHATSTDGPTSALLREMPKSDRQFFQLLSRINRLPVSSAETIRILRDAEEFYPALEERIRQAQHHVHLEFYICQNDGAGKQFLGWLADAARRGVMVRLLLDEMGSHFFDEKLLADYLEAGGRFSWFQSLDPKRNRFFFNLRNHRKLQIIDGTCAFVGGMNIGDEYKGLNPRFGLWRDVQVEVSGAIACDLQEVFADDWFFATGEQITEPCFYPCFTGKPRHPVSIVLGGPDIRNEPISKSLVSLLNEASDRVWIAAGYFVPDDTLLTALEIAAARGVEVRLLISEKNDHPFLITVGRSYYGQLLAAGVRIFEYSEGINHSKIAVADGSWSMVGSANLDYRSMRLNFELNLLFHSTEQNAALSRIFERDFIVSQEIDLEIFSNRSKKEKAMECILRPLSPML